jgi:hypothetical protein
VAKDDKALRGEGKGREAACNALAPPRTLRKAAAKQPAYSPPAAGAIAPRIRGLSVQMVRALSRCQRRQRAWKPLVGGRSPNGRLQRCGKDDPRQSLHGRMARSLTRREGWQRDAVGVRRTGDYLPHPHKPRSSTQSGGSLMTNLHAETKTA